MVEYPRKPRLTHRDDVVRVVEELRKFGISGMQLYRSVTEIGPVDLDVGAIGLEHRISGRVTTVRRAQDRPAGVLDPANRLTIEVHQAPVRVLLGVHQPVEAIADAGDQPSAISSGERD